MNKATLLALLLVVITLGSCRNDDDGDGSFIPARDRGEEAPNSTSIIEDYLDTHFYNYEEFEAPPADFDFKIRFDTIAGENSDKIPLRTQVDSKTVVDRVDTDVTYTLYYLKVAEGGTENNPTKSPTFGDVATLEYEAHWINEEPNVPKPYTDLLDSSVTPVTFNLTSIVNGLQDGLQEFSEATDITINDDGSLTPENPGIGAVFMQSGLGYYVNESGQGGDVPVYAQLFFTFTLYTVADGDQDNDGILTINEDLNGNGLEEDDDTDGDGLPNFFDGDDDNDGRPTSEEIIVEDDGTITYPDTDNDGIVDYLDSDS